MRGSCRPRPPHRPRPQTDGKPLRMNRGNVPDTLVGSDRLALTPPEARGRRTGDHSPITPKRDAPGGAVGRFLRFCHVQAPRGVPPAGGLVPVRGGAACSEDRTSRRPWRSLPGRPRGGGGLAGQAASASRRPSTVPAIRSVLHTAPHPSFVGGSVKSRLSWLPDTAESTQILQPLRRPRATRTA